MADIDRVADQALDTGLTVLGLAEGLSGEPEEILEASVEAAVAALLDLTSR